MSGYVTWPDSSQAGDGQLKSKTVSEKMSGSGERLRHLERPQVGRLADYEAYTIGGLLIGCYAPRLSRLGARRYLQEPSFETAFDAFVLCCQCVAIRALRCDGALA